MSKSKTWPPKHMTPKTHKQQGGLKQDDDYKKNTPIIMKDLLSILSQITFR
jgi:hypothetical protein